MACHHNIDQNLWPVHGSIAQLIAAQISPDPGGLIPQLV